MREQHKRRMAGLGFFSIMIALSAMFAVVALRRNVTYFRTPSMLEDVAPGQKIRIGGRVVDIGERGMVTSFVLSDCDKEQAVVFAGPPPDLFVLGQDAVAVGRLDEQGLFVADQLLAKHDENYTIPGGRDAYAQAGCFYPQGQLRAAKSGLLDARSE